LCTAGVVAAGTYNINVVATIAGATGSPFTQPFTITGTTVSTSVPPPPTTKATVVHITSGMTRAQAQTVINNASNATVVINSGTYTWNDGGSIIFKGGNDYVGGTATFPYQGQSARPVINFAMAGGGWSVDGQSNVNIYGLQLNNGNQPAGVPTNGLLTNADHITVTNCIFDNAQNAATNWLWFGNSSFMTVQWNTASHYEGMNDNGGGTNSHDILLTHNDLEQFGHVAWNTVRWSFQNHGLEGVNLQFTFNKQIYPDAGSPIGDGIMLEWVPWDDGVRPVPSQYIGPVTNEKINDNYFFGPPAGGNTVSLVGQNDFEVARNYIKAGPNGAFLQWALEIDLANNMTMNIHDNIMVYGGSPTIQGPYSCAYNDLRINNNNWFGALDGLWSPNGLGCSAQQFSGNFQTDPGVVNPPAAGAAP
jgi:hypothetical protein